MIDVRQIADDVAAGRPPARRSVTDHAAEVLAARQAAHEAAEAAALSEPDPEPVTPVEPAPVGPRVALVPGHGLTDRRGPDFDAIAALAWGRS